MTDSRVASLAALLRPHVENPEEVAEWLIARGVTVGPIEELARFAEGDTRPVPQTYTTASGSRLGEPSPEPPTEILADAVMVAAFVAGWWPGLEDGITWGDSENAPEYLAAKRVTKWYRERAGVRAGSEETP